MKTNYLKYAPVLLVALFATGNASADSVTSAAGIQQYVESTTTPGLLVPDNTATLASVLAGNRYAPGGNIELGTITDGLSNGAFAIAPVSTLTVNLAGGDIVFSSLTGADWGASGSGGLLDQWTNNLYSAYGSYIKDPGTGNPVSQNDFKTQFVLSRGRQRLSDPNISYVDPDGSFGLAGFLDASVLFPPGYLPTGAQISEIAKVTYQGNTSFAYRIGNGTATPSGVHTADGSYDGNYHIPEPSELALLAVGLTGFLGLRRKVVKA